MVPCACGCGTEIKSVDDYGRKRSYITGHNGRKYADSREYHRQWRLRNKEKRYNYKKERWRMLKVKLIMEFGGGMCQRKCGVAYDGTNAAVFHFHHLDPATKSFALGNKLTSMSWAKIVAEVQKCEMICANCHELSHSERF